MKDKHSPDAMRPTPGAPSAPTAPTAPTTASPATPTGGGGEGGGDGGGGERPSLLPSVTVPKGGGAIRGIGEKFAANPVTGTGSFTVPVAVSPGRSGFGPELALSYDSGSGNGPFGWGFGLSLPAITRKTDKGLPRYVDEDESDTFILSGAEDLVPVLVEGVRHREVRTLEGGATYTVRRYRPRTEGLFSRIERWTDAATGVSHWRSISKDNITTVYGRSAAARVADPDDATRVFTWLIEESRDDKGNVLGYEYKPEDAAGVDPSAPEEQHRLQPGAGFAARHIKRIRYGNRVPYQAGPWLFEVVFDYGEHDDEAPRVTEDRPWPARPDAFSSYRAGFEMRTYRRCRRVLMFHCFPELSPEGGPTGKGDGKGDGEGDGAGDCEPCLVRSTELDYRESVTGSFVTAVTQRGWVRRPEHEGGGYRTSALPPVELSYTEARIDETLRELDAESLDNLPQGLAGSGYQWVDLYNEGLPGILTEQGDAWYYKPNRGEGRFGPLERVRDKPALARLATGRQQILDIEADGRNDLVQFQQPMAGFHAQQDDGSWGPFRALQAVPNIDFGDPRLRFVDLTGDGRADILITEDHVLTWYPSRGTEGFGAAERVHTALDEVRGPTVVFMSDQRANESFHLADMSGDGLVDLVRIRSGEVCYWPNLGYGRFGAKVTMGDAPVFDHVDQVDHGRIRLADVDGSGVTDIVYLGRDRVCIYLNESGNRFGPAHELTSLPPLDNMAGVAVADLLGNGTAALVLSSALPGEAGRPVRYVDLMSGQKPHLLVKVVNNLGAETHVRYVASTRFYLADLAADRPWVTKLPFPVHVLDRVEIRDRVSRNRFVTRYAYHHGHYDGVEREFRGFGMVEQWDTETFEALRVAEGADGAADDGGYDTNIDAATHVPPIRTKTWFHTGVYRRGQAVSRQFAREYYRAPGQSDAELAASLLPDTVLPAGPNAAPGATEPGALGPEEEREAVRALRGSVLRREVYADDGSDKAGIPYTVSEQSYTIEVLQGRGPNRYGVFFVHPRETISYQLERNPDDPRVSHELVLEVDDFGNVLRSAAIGYGRRPDMADRAIAETLAEGAIDERIREAQTRLLCTLTENDFTNFIDEPDAYRARMLCEARTYELTGLMPAPGARLSFAEVERASREAAPLAYEATPSTGLTYAVLQERRAQAGSAADVVVEKRIVEHQRTLYRRDDLAGPLPRGRVESLALPFEGHQLALTPGLIAQVYDDRVTGDDMVAEGGYMHSEGDDNWWIPTGQVSYAPAPPADADDDAGDDARDGDAWHDDSAAELAHARAHFFLPRRARDPFGNVMTVIYDRHDLLVVDTRDPLGNRVTAGERAPDGAITALGLDYRVLQPGLVMDPNRNRSAVAFDALGMVVGTAVMGKPEERAGDSLDGFVADLDDDARRDHFADPLAAAHELLGRASTRLVYDLDAFRRAGQPAVVHTLARETHDADLAPGEETRIKHGLVYADGFGREIQKKMQAEPGPLEPGGPEASPRWVGSGWTIFNNKGKPVRQYEPFFSATHGFEFAKMVGVSPILFYDPAERVIATLHPNHTWEKVVFDPWRQVTWDVNDTALDDPGLDPDIGGFVARLAEDEYRPTWYEVRKDGALGKLEKSAAAKTAVHARTPTVAHFDALGRAIVTVAHNRFVRKGETFEEFYATRVQLDIEGNQRAVIDAKDRLVMLYDYDLLANRIHQASMDAGRRWKLGDIGRNPVYGWDSRSHRIHNGYDDLRRPSAEYLSTDGAPEITTLRTVYGESLPAADAEASNLRGQAVWAYDNAGLVTADLYDFKGNLLRESRQLTVEYREIPDWSQEVPLEDEIFTTTIAFDALSREIAQTTPDNSTVRRRYNEAGLLEYIEANLRGAEKVTVFVKDIDYDAKGQRDRIAYGNGVVTSYRYDPLTFRLERMLTLRRGSQRLQDLSYTYDPAGNITYIRDDAQQTIFFRNQVVDPSNDYTYDAAYRLIEATGREHLGQVVGGVLGPVPTSDDDAPRAGLPHPNNGNAMSRYLRRYAYDEAGNILALRHRSAHSRSPGWTRYYRYNEANLLNPETSNNRLTATQPGRTSEHTYAYDAHGNMRQMPHLHQMLWNHNDKLHHISCITGKDTNTGKVVRCTYDGDGLRIRKITALGKCPDRKTDDIHVTPHFEIYSRRRNLQGAPDLKSTTIRVRDGRYEIALIETCEGQDAVRHSSSIIYQISNHAGSVSIEINSCAKVISHEEYFPYGPSSFQGGSSHARARQKRYRFSGKERDGETGLYYYGARYYAAWIARWTSPDPLGPIDSLNVYTYVRNNPIRFTDSTGMRLAEASDRTTQTPLPGDVAEARRIGKERGKQYGELDAKAVRQLSKLHRKVGGGRSLWDRMPNEWRSDFISGIITAYESLPTLTGPFKDPDLFRYAQEEFDRQRTKSFVEKSASMLSNEIKTELVLYSLPGLAASLRRSGSAYIQTSANARRSDTSYRYFYTVQGPNDAARLRTTGTPWPTGPTEAHFGQGVYAWGSETEALQYLQRRSRIAPNLEVVEFRVKLSTLRKFRQLNVDSLRDPTQWLSSYSRLYPKGTPTHGLQYIRRGTGNSGVEHYFHYSTFESLEFQLPTK
ncbi:SpvB/TcaC N-terminal domain-containing protein [Haliangium sp.]|uniref:SpvB/TcaC N-terminal domain-containing protein n=1 Tax=Haliangium sp. TaxID=2663208 RepID=UPI003D0D7AD8